jgi:hypothetical protein
VLSPAFAKALPSLDVLRQINRSNPPGQRTRIPCVTDTKELMTFAPLSSGEKSTTGVTGRSLASLDRCSPCVTSNGSAAVSAVRISVPCLIVTSRALRRRERRLARDRGRDRATQLVPDQAAEAHRRLAERHRGDVIFSGDAVQHERERGRRPGNDVDQDYPERVRKEVVPASAATERARAAEARPCGSGSQL